MTISSKEIRKTFLEFFKSKQHTIVPSAPIVVKNDPTLMFTNAGMNQFKDIFLGNKTPVSKRVADTQKCLRVSGKHNDLEEVGIDTYHHTMFEMLGNWSFGDPDSPDGVGTGYFKEEAIEWAWELLTKVYKIPVDRLYVTIFGGDEKENLPTDEEAISFWKKHVNADHILSFGKKDNFWEMGDTGPCGPCSEIHFDSRDDTERKKVDGKTLVNASDPEVIEIWNLVFIQFNRQGDQSLKPLPAKHVDTGMGFERLTRVLQEKKSNYDSDIFQPLIYAIQIKWGKIYGKNEAWDIAMRVIADHIRAVSFSIADGQLPSNTGSGYVIRRILRRAVRYGYSFLSIEKPFIFELVDTLANDMGDQFPELINQKEFIKKVIKEEEISFFKTLTEGMWKLDYYFQYGYHHGRYKSFPVSDAELIESHRQKIIPGKFAFNLYDTDGFPLDLTKLIATEKGFTVDENGFEDEMQKQKSRSRKAAEVVTSDWVEIKKADKIEFVGYDSLETKASVVKYRKQKAKDKEIFQLVLDRTPFYAESGGQVGDKGKILFGTEEVEVLDTKKENELIIHFVNKFPSEFNSEVIAQVNIDLREETMNNHTATHLLHAALRKTLGTHVQQKGSLVAPDYLRFDFSHFAKVSKEELEAIEAMVNEKIRENILRETEVMPIDEAMKTGAMALFGEKYGDKVRVVTFDKNFSRELCGGTHVPATGAIGYFKIISEGAVAAGVRRIEAVTGIAAEKLIRETFNRMEHLLSVVGTDVEKGITHLQEENSKLKKQVEEFSSLQVNRVKEELKSKVSTINGINFIAVEVSVPSADALKKLAYDLRNEIENLFFVAGAAIDGKAHLSIIIAENLVNEKSLDAGKIIKAISKEIHGGGGGQKFFATAGGTNVPGIGKAIAMAKDFLPQ